MMFQARKISAESRAARQLGVVILALLLVWNQTYIPLHLAGHVHLTQTSVRPYPKVPRFESHPPEKKGAGRLSWPRLKHSTRSSRTSGDSSAAPQEHEPHFHPHEPLHWHQHSSSQAPAADSSHSRGMQHSAPESHGATDDSSHKPHASSDHLIGYYASAALAVSPEAFWRPVFPCPPEHPRAAVEPSLNLAASRGPPAAIA